MDWPQLLTQLEALFAGLYALGSDEAADEALAASGDRFYESSVAWAASASPGAEPQPQPGPEERRRLLHLQLATASGAAALPDTAAASALSTRGASEAETEAAAHLALLEAQASALEEGIPAYAGLLQRQQEGVPGFSEALAAWVAKAAGCLETVHPYCRAGPGSAYALALARLGSIVGLLPAHGMEAMVHVLSKSGLVRSLLRLLAPFICASAVALQLPAERRPREVSWHRAAHVAAFVHAALCAEDKAATGPLLPGRVLAAAAQLVQHAPPVTCGASLRQLHWLALQLGMVCWHFLDAPQEQQTQQVGQADKVLAALPRLPELLQAAPAGQLATFVPIELGCLLVSLQSTVQLAASWHNGAPPRQLSSLPGLCIPAAAVLQALPAAAEALGIFESAAGADEQLARMRQHGLLRPGILTAEAVDLAATVSNACQAAADGLQQQHGSALAAADLAAAVPAMCALHAQLCRLVHWSLCSEGSVFGSLAPLRCWEELLPFTLCALAAASGLLYQARQQGMEEGSIAAEIRRKCW
ncbi:hypothetical protein ABPG75_002483 [Micractinium tetrahymenae]